MDARKNKRKYDKVTGRRVTPLRVAARLEGKVKNRGIKPRRKTKRARRAV